LLEKRLHDGRELARPTPILLPLHRHPFVDRHPAEAGVALAGNAARGKSSRHIRIAIGVAAFAAREVHRFNRLEGRRELARRHALEKNAEMAVIEGNDVVFAHDWDWVGEFRLGDRAGPRC
jgi:hypothetical protein